MLRTQHAVYNIFGGRAAVVTPLVNTHPLLSMDTVGNGRTVVKNIRSFEVAYLWYTGKHFPDRRPCPVNRFSNIHPRRLTARPVVLVRQYFRHPSARTPHAYRPCASNDFCFTVRHKYKNASVVVDPCVKHVSQPSLFFLILMPFMPTVGPPILSIDESALGTRAARSPAIKRGFQTGASLKICVFLTNVPRVIPNYPLIYDIIIDIIEVIDMTYDLGASHLFQPSTVVAYYVLNYYFDYVLIDCCKSRNSYILFRVDFEV
ncbi:hypothetical protein QTP88_022896 [Uroleucon formosanum]